MSTNLISSSSSSCYLICHGQDRIAQTCASTFSFPTTKRSRTMDRTHQSFSNLAVKYGSILMARPKSGMLVQVKASSSPNSSSSSWPKWVVGILMTAILGYKGGLLSNLKSKIDRAIQIVGNLAKVVEEVAEEAEKIVEEVEEKLPGDSQLKHTLESFDELAKKAVSEAKMAEDVVHKVKDVEEEIEETMRKGGKGQPKN